MKTSLSLTLACVVVLVFAGAAAPRAQAQHLYDATPPTALLHPEVLPRLLPPQPSSEHLPVQWARFSDAIVEALASGSEALQVAALRMIIQYGPRLEVRDGVFDVVRLYRDHENDNLRRMAVVALGQMQSDWAIDFLMRSIRYEKTPRVLHTVKSVVAAHQDAEREADLPSLQVAENAKN